MRDPRYDGPPPGAVLALPPRADSNSGAVVAGLFAAAALAGVVVWRLGSESGPRPAPAPLARPPQPALPAPAATDTLHRVAAEMGMSPFAPVEEVAARSEVARLRAELQRVEGAEAAARAECEALRADRARALDDFKEVREELDQTCEGVLDAAERVREDMLRELLPALDNFERAVQHADAAGDDGVAEGLRMALGQLDSALRGGGLERVPTVGEPFDPAHHEAVAQNPSAEFPAGVVAVEVRSGYRAADGRLVRAAQVVVSAGPAPR